MSDKFVVEFGGNVKKDKTVKEATHSFVGSVEMTVAELIAAASSSLTISYAGKIRPLIGDDKKLQEFAEKNNIVIGEPTKVGAKKPVDLSKLTIEQLQAELERRAAMGE